MLKKVVILVLVTLFVAGVMPAVAGQDTEVGGKEKQEWIFQTLADDISELDKSESGQKESMTKTFQKVHDYIIESAPKARNLSLRGQKEELERRRGIK